MMLYHVWDIDEWNIPATMFTHSKHRVSLLVYSQIAFNVLAWEVDSEGRYIFVHCKIFKLVCILINVNVPPPFSTVVLSYYIFSWTSLMVMGDFVGCTVCAQL